MHTPQPSPAPSSPARLVLGLLLAVAVLISGLAGPPPGGRDAAMAASAAASTAAPAPAATVRVIVAGVVEVTARTATGRQAGTGVVVTRSGLIITNAHVVAGSDQVSVRLPGTGREFPAEMVGVDHARDIALLRVAARLRPAPVGDSDDVLVGDIVTSVGNAYGRGWMASGTGRVLATGVSTTLTADTTAGPVAAASGSGESRAAGTRLTGLIAARTNIRPGQSGGATFNQDGEVIGINVAYALPQPTKAWRQVGYAIPINTALAVAHRLLPGGPGQ